MEAGTHLFLPKHGGPVPLRVNVLDAWPGEVPDPFAFGPILRVYPEGQPVADVRTGLVSPLPGRADFAEMFRTFTLAALGQSGASPLLLSEATTRREKQLRGLTPPARQEQTMPTVRYHALLCRDAAGGYSAVALDGGVTGFGATATDARDDLKEYLRWAHRKDPSMPVPDFTEPELRWFTVTVRPEYKAKDRFYPSDAEVPVRVPCVVGVRRSGQFAADLPLLGMCFDYPGRMELQRLVERYVSQKLEGLTPEQLAAFLPPPHAELIELAIPIPKEPPGALNTIPPPPTLAKVAEPVGDRAVRKGYARAWGRETELVAVR